MSDNLADLCEQAWFSGANDAPDLWGTFAAYLTEHGVTLAAPPSAAAAPLDVERLTEAISEHFASGRHGYSGHACATAIAFTYAAPLREALIQRYQLWHREAGNLVDEWDASEWSVIGIDGDGRPHALTPEADRE